jgi:hypothetical protein
MEVINKHIFQVFLFAVRSSMGQIKSTGLVLSEKKNLVQIPIGSHSLLFSMKFTHSVVSKLCLKSQENMNLC